jgi:ubiquinone/menaquinone biosynthesis C-methylase UbiE
MPPIRLNLGAGTSRHKDYISVDFHQEADVRHDLTQPLPYEDNSVDAIYSSHVIEHFTRAEWDGIAKDWARVLKPGGVMELRCPDIRKLCQSVVDDQDIELAITRIYGQQGDDGQLHKNGFTQELLAKSFPNFSYKVLEPSTEYELHMEFVK